MVEGERRNGHGRTVRRTKEKGKCTVAASTGDTKVALSVADWIFLRGFCIRAVPVVTPFLDVAVHIIKAPWVGSGLTNVQRCRLGQAYTARLFYKFFVEDVS